MDAKLTTTGQAPTVRRGTGRRRPSPVLALAVLSGSALVVSGCAAGAGTASDSVAPPAPTALEQESTPASTPAATPTDAAPTDPAVPTVTGPPPSEPAPGDSDTAEPEPGEDESGEGAAGDRTGTGSGAAIVGPAEFTTQNGTMRMPLPAGWRVDDWSGETLNHDGRTQWDNVLMLTRDDGTSVRYYDGYGSDVGSTNPWQEIDRIDMGEGLAAAAWVEWWEGGARALVALTTADPGEHPYSGARLDGVNRNYRVDLGLGDGSGGWLEFATADEAAEFLRTEPAQAALELIASMELLPVDQYAMP